MLLTIIKNIQQILKKIEQKIYKKVDALLLVKNIKMLTENYKIEGKIKKNKTK